MTDHLDPDVVEVQKHLTRCLEYLTSRAASAATGGTSDDLRHLRHMISAIQACERAVRGDSAVPTIQPNPANLVCATCGSAEIECLDWVLVNDDFCVGGNEVVSSDDYWCPDCEVHDEPVTATDYCGEHGHRGSPCAVCGVV